MIGNIVTYLVTLFLQRFYNVDFDRNLTTLFLRDLAPLFFIMTPRFLFIYGNNVFGRDLATFGFDRFDFLYRFDSIVFDKFGNIVFWGMTLNF